MPPSGGGLSFHYSPFPGLPPLGYDMPPSGEGSNTKTDFRQTLGLGELLPTQERLISQVEKNRRPA